jgi:hypothetical protein
MNETEINDVRNPKDFKGITFSKFKKTDVRKELLKSLTQSKIEPACYWSAELICCGDYSYLWEIILLFYSKFIHLGNPKIAIYLNMRMDTFKELVAGHPNLLYLRNNDRIRKLFAEIMCVLCDAKRRHSFDNIRVTKDDFDMTQMTDRFKAPNVSFAEGVFREEDPKELFIAINELAFTLHEHSKSIISACYWIEWIMEFETVCKHKKDKIRAETRSQYPVDHKYQRDIIWIVWDIFLLEAAKRGKFAEKVVKALLNLFTVQYSTGYGKRRKYILYFVVSILCEGKLAAEEEIIRERQKEVVANVLRKIDSIYKQIKQNEESPKMDYLFQHLGAGNMEKTIEKLEKMNSFGETFLPRI